MGTAVLLGSLVGLSIVGATALYGAGLQARAVLGRIGGTAIKSRLPATTLRRIFGAMILLTAMALVVETLS